MLPRVLDRSQLFLLSADGLFVGMAPPQSYLDIYSSNWSRFVNLTDPEREWHSDFHYFGNNVYAYILKKYAKFLDLVSIQVRSYMCGISNRWRGILLIHHHRSIRTVLRKLFQSCDGGVS